MDSRHQSNPLRSHDQTERSATWLHSLTSSSKPCATAASTADVVSPSTMSSRASTFTAAPVLKCGTLHAKKDVNAVNRKRPSTLRRKADRFLKHLYGQQPKAARTGDDRDR
ncbi:hypothetical protein KCU95_g8174, partial [Aureobasidium melanogenum]